jgi:hypothetical protein
MATATVQPSSEPLTVPDVLGPELFVFLQRRAKMAGLDWQNFLSQLVEVHRVETRFVKVERISKWRQERERRRAQLVATTNVDVHKTKHAFNAEQVQRIVFLFHDADPPLPIETIAERFDCSPSTIHRILAQHKRLHRMAVRGTNAGKGGNNNFLYGQL